VDRDRRDRQALVTALPVRIGVLLPPGNPTVEAEMVRMAPSRVSFHYARLEAPGVTSVPGVTEGMVERARAFLAGLDGPARALGRSRPSVVALAHTASSYAAGFANEPQLIARLSAAAGCPALTAARAIVDALAHLGVRRLALGTPYSEEISAQGRAYWEEAGMTVVRHRRLEGVVNVYEETEARAAALARDADAPDAQAVLLSGTGLPTVGVLDALEQALGKPVLSSNQALLWSALETAGVREPIVGFGALLRQRNPGSGR
jgi:maleate cis-trans isomerase